MAFFWNEFADFRSQIECAKIYDFVSALYKAKFDRKKAQRVASYEETNPYEVREKALVLVVLACCPSMMRFTARVR
jgi:hypothetical protein